MPHQCVKCGVLHGDASSAILKGCTSCGGKLFFYVKDGDLKRAKERSVNLSPKDKSQIESDVYDIIGSEFDRELPVVLDFESINIISPGKYELDLVNLFKSKQPLIYKLEDGKYMIDLIETFKKFNSNRK
ncbi:MAG: Zn-ribbon domain-containing protein [Candidatus Woesearchaeota archaeon]